MTTNAQQHYTTLRLTPGASPAAIRQAYKTLVKCYHPDIVAPEKKAEAARRLRQVILAYKALTQMENTLATPPRPAAPTTPPTVKAARQRLKSLNDNQNQTGKKRVKARATAWNNIAEIFWPLTPKQEKNNHV